jgi:DNA-binding LytR/AlgR family response regulator
MQILILEDEIKAARELQRMIVEIIPEAEIVACLFSVKSAIEWFQKNQEPTLIFSDIQLADGLCFDIFKKVSVKTPIIFCTAFNQYAINAFEANSIDYLLKPIDEEQLKKSINKFRAIKDYFSESQVYYQKIERVLEELSQSHKTTFLVHQQDKIIPIKTEEISFIYSTEGDTKFYTLQNKKFQTSHTLDALEKQLSNKLFYRANRQFIIHRNSILVVHQYLGRKLLVKLKSDTPENIIISKTKASEFLKWFEV